MIDKNTRKIYFSKMHGIGNDFVIIDKINQNFKISELMINKISDRNTGIGFDQLLIVELSNDKIFDFYYRIFNANGKEVSQCGNGARCFAYFVYLKKMTKKKILSIKTNTNNINIEIFNEKKIQVNMGYPIFRPEKIPICFSEFSLEYNIIVNKRKIVFGAVSIGNPHCVIIVSDLKKYPVNQIGAFISNNSLFPNQINVNFMEIMNRNCISLRVYERHVGETKACGSGACASVVIGIMKNYLDTKVTVILPGGKLYINWNGLGFPIYMKGPVKHVYDGCFNI